MESGESATGHAIAVTQTFRDLLKANSSYLNWLESIGAREAKRDFISSLMRAEPPATLAYLSVYSVPTPLVRLGSTTMSPYTHRSTNLTAIADPLNVILTGNANVERVADIFEKELFPPWLDTVTGADLYTCANTQWVYVDDGVEPKWQEMNYTLALGGCTFNRCHIRLFDGGYDPELGEYTLVNAHYEHWEWTKDHVVEDWDKSQRFIQSLFERKPFTKSIRIEKLQSDEEIQSVHHDGLGTVIELG